MFTTAIQRASQFTRPVILSRRFYDGSVESGLGAFVVVNADGWIVTAAHVFHAEIDLPAHQQEIVAYEAAKGGKNRLKRNPRWLTNHSYWWARDGVKIDIAQLSFEIDLAIARLTPWDPEWISGYPTFRDLAHGVPQGLSVCRLGYPFHDFKATFDQRTGFTLPADALPAPQFPLDGIVTRELRGQVATDGKYSPHFIETSTPGLRGQSGGPLFDVEGRVVGIQSRTNHLELGFSPKSTQGKVEYQFLNVGVAVHPALLQAFLRDHDVKFAIA